jgi:hypothetical protein
MTSRSSTQVPTHILFVAHADTFPKYSGPMGDMGATGAPLGAGTIMARFQF